MKTAARIVFLTLVLVFGAAPHAHAAAPTITITGIAGIAGNPAQGITPWATCNGNKKHATSPTDADGKFTIVFAANDCLIGATATIHVYEKIAGGTTYVGAKNVVITGEVTHADIVAFDPVGVPEYEIAMGAVALGGGLGVIIFMRNARQRQSAGVL